MVNPQPPFHFLLDVLTDGPIPPNRPGPKNLADGFCFGLSQNGLVERNAPRRLIAHDAGVGGR